MRSFCDNNLEFGADSEEMDALLIKQDAIRVIEELAKDVTKANLLNTLFKLPKEKGECSTLTAILLFVQGRYDNNSTAMLRKALKNADLDSGIVLLFFSEKSQYNSLCMEISRVSEFHIHPEISKLLATYYDFEENIVVGNLLQHKTVNGGEI